MMRYMVVCKDHFTGLVAAARIPRKRATFVALALSEIFGQIGYPLILHTDNGKEFTG
jgi:transposase InsO family protein